MQFSDQFLQAIDHYFKGTATEAEKEMLNKWYHQHNDAMVTVDTNDADYEHLLETRLKNRIRESIGIEQPKQRRLWPRIISIAAAVAVIAVCVYLYRPADALLSSRVSRDLNDIPPGGNRATLTSNGNTINLSEIQTGLAIDANQLSYNDGTKIDPSKLGMIDGDSRSLQVSVPRGGTYSIILQDGTKIWLNADSKLEFFSNYRNKLQRIVKLIAGEAYFEVAKDPKRPFKVQTEGQEITVLGTHFNISVYKEDVGIRTTLLEGSVRVANLSPSGRDVGTTERVLKPNEQSILTNDKITVKQVDVNEVVMWKAGKFSFTSEEMSSVMQKVARWYNVDVAFADGTESIKVSGSAPRFANISTLLNTLEQTGLIHYKIEGRKVIISK